MEETLIPYAGIVTKITGQTPDVKTFRVEAPDGGKLFEHLPGQCAMLSVPGISEAMISITSSPTNKEFMEFSVKNVNDETMYFSLGAHPAFAIDLGDKVVLDEDQTLDAFKLDENFLRGQVTQPVFANSRELVITPELFEKDALIFDGLTARGASVIRQNGKNVHVAFDAPCLGIWAKPAAPYVCIEPWHGIDDTWDAGHDFTKKERIEVLGAGETWVFPVTITAMNG